MIARLVLLALLPIIAIAALTQRRRLAAIIGMGLFSLVLAATYLLLHAADVAITEAAVGAALVTAIYVLAIRRTGRIVLVADEAPGLIGRENERIVGLEHEILQGFADHVGLDLTIRVVPHEDVLELLATGDADIGAGGLVPTIRRDALATPSYLTTALFAVAGAAAERPEQSYTGYFSDLEARLRADSQLPVTLDLARFLALTRRGIDLAQSTRLEGSFAYSMLVAPGRSDLHRDLSAYIEELRAGGKLDELIARHVV